MHKRYTQSLERTTEMEELAYEMWGKPNSGLSSHSELRFGSKGSLSVDLNKCIWYDHETGEGGGFVDLYRLVHHRDPGEDWKNRRPVIDPSDQAAIAARNAESVQRIWQESRPAGSTVVERYLCARGIDMPVPDDLRRHPKLYHNNSNTWWPAMIAAVRDSAGQMVAIHRTWLYHVVAQPGKAPIDPNKMSLGPIRGCAIRLSAPGPVLLIGEGIETTLSVMFATGLPGWSSISAGNMKNLTLPPVVREVILLADNDTAGERFTDYAAWRWEQLGLIARIAYPPDRYNDFNDQLSAGQ
jgi:putative DNA primase/helicase